MTTPENLKKRQERILKLLRIEGLVLALVLVVVGLSEIWENRENERQDACVAEQITSLQEALNSRAALTQKLNAATAEVIDSFAIAAANQAPENATPEEEREASQPIIDALDNYTEVREKVKDLQKKNPFPPFPEGTCD